MCICVIEYVTLCSFFHLFFPRPSRRSLAGSPTIPHGWENPHFDPSILIIIYLLEYVAFPTSHVRQRRALVKIGFTRFKVSHYQENEARVNYPWETPSPPFVFCVFVNCGVLQFAPRARGGKWATSKKNHCGNNFGRKFNWLATTFELFSLLIENGGKNIKTFYPHVV